MKLGRRNTLYIINTTQYTGKPAYSITQIAEKFSSRRALFYLANNGKFRVDVDSAALTHLLQFTKSG
jgi:hypothetical protein